MARIVPDYLKKMLGAYDAELLSASHPGETMLDTSIMSEEGLEAKFQGLRDRIERRLMQVGLKSPKSHKFTAEKWTPWISAETPEERLKVLLRKRSLNAKLVAFLWSHLLQHLALEELMEKQIKEAREEMEAAESHLPKSFVDLVQMLRTGGLKASVAQGISKADATALAAYLNARKSPEGMAALTALMRIPNKVTEERVAESEREAEAFRREVEQRPVQSPPEPVAEVYEPIVPEGYPERWQRAMGAIPRDFWSSIGDGNLPYSWSREIDESPESEDIRDMPLPTADEWDELREVDANFGRVAKPGMLSRGSGETRLRTYFAALRGIDERSVPDVWVRTWIFLLYGRHADLDDVERKFGIAYFDGIGMPDPVNGSMAVRRLKRVL